MAIRATGFPCRCEMKTKTPENLYSNKVEKPPLVADGQFHVEIDLISDRVYVELPFD